MAQRRSAGTALDYVRGLAPGVKANCWGLAEAAGHESPYRMQALLGSYRWDWKDLRAELPALARAWLPCDPGDLIGPGIAVDETAQLKDGDATACVAPQHAGCTGHVENCITTVFSAWVATSGQAWADFDVFMPGRWEKDWQRRRAARIPGKLERKTKPQLAIGQLNRLLDAGLPAKWAAYDEVYGRSSELRRFCESRNLAYVAVVPCDFRVTLPSGAVIRADEAVRERGLRAALVRERVQGPAVRGLGADRHQQPAALPAHPPPDLPPGRPGLLPVLVAGGHPGDHDVLHHHRRPQVAGRTNVQDREGHTRLGPVPGPRLGRGSAGTPPWPPWRSCGRQRSATTCAATSPSRTPPPAAATTTAATARTTSAALTCASRSATRPSPPAAGSPARPASPRSGSPSPRPPASNAWPGSTPPG